MSEKKLLNKVENYLRTELFPDIDPLSQRTFLGLYQLVATGDPVSLERLSEAAGINLDTVKNRLDWVEPSRLQYNEAGRIVAFAGLSQEPTSHRFLFKGRELFTWCAFDTLFLPQLLGGDAQISSTCPVTDSKIQLTVTSDGPREIRPDSTVMSFVMPDAENCCGDLRGTFCNHVNFFASPEAGSIWQQSNEGAIVLSIEEAFKLGEARNDSSFKDALVTSIEKPEDKSVTSTIRNTE